jgi:hypothetical protein
VSDPRPIVAATLREVAEWGLHFVGDDRPARDELRDIATAVERVEANDGCCPVCEEVTCDSGLPARNVPFSGRPDVTEDLAA